MEITKEDLLKQHLSFDLPVGYLVWWPKSHEKEIPEGWVKTGRFLTDGIFLIRKVDNLTWIEHVAKERHLV